jgi:hypothetical protein
VVVDTLSPWDKDILIAALKERKTCEKFWKFFSEESAFVACRIPDPG